MKKVTFIFSDSGGRGSERIMTGIANALAQSERYREKGVKRAQDFRTETIMPQYKKVLLGEDESNAL